MPTSGISCPYEGHQRLWEKCRKQIGDQMVASGWIRKAGKFDEVCLRKAHKLFMKVRP
jgi:hypothetical protein